MTRSRNIVLKFCGSPLLLLALLVLTCISTATASFDGRNEQLNPDTDELLQGTLSSLLLLKEIFIFAC